MFRSILDFSLLRRATQYRDHTGAQSLNGRKPHHLIVEVYTCDQLAALSIAWHDLYARSLEPNIFLHPDFATPALAYLQPKRLRMMAVFDDAGAERRLVALAPIVLPRFAGGIARGLLHKQSALGMPLLDRQFAVKALLALLDAIKGLPCAPSALILNEVPRDGATARVLGELLGKDTRLRVLRQYERAALFLATAPGRVNQKTKARKNALRLLRRFSERGALSYSMWRGADVPAAMTEFLALEASGWKGASRTALGSTPGRATFAHEVAIRLAAAQKLRIESLDLDGRPVAMGIILEDQAGAYFWKTAYDEAFAAYSPGVLFSRELTKRLSASRSVMKVDSCAMPGHPMIDHLWPDRVAMTDVAIVLAPGARGPVALGAERLRRHARGLAKAMLLRGASGKARIARTLRARS